MRVLRVGVIAASLRSMPALGTARITMIEADGLGKASVEGHGRIREPRCRRQRPTARPRMLRVRRGSWIQLAVSP
jgi:hypothetical protein